MSGSGRFAFGDHGILVQSEKGWTLIPWRAVLCVECVGELGALNRSTLRAHWHNGHVSMEIPADKRDDALARLAAAMTKDKA